ncbi:hypothetical protein RCT18_06975, partial [Escherichia marmotae]|nr:hypothetical protein [Escherichia marmotae]
KCANNKHKINLPSLLNSRKTSTDYILMIFLTFLFVTFYHLMYLKIFSIENYATYFLAQRLNHQNKLILN